MASRRRLVNCMLNSKRKTTLDHIYNISMVVMLGKDLTGVYNTSTVIMLGKDL